MCDCYYHKCCITKCEHAVPMHIADFKFPRRKFTVWCENHAYLARPGAVLFTRLDDEKFPHDWTDEILSFDKKGWQCAIRGPRVGTDSGNDPNVGGEFSEEVVK